MENFIEKPTIPELLKELHWLLETGHLFGALFIVLSIPDSLGKAAYPNIKSSKGRYIKWFDNHVYNLFGMLYSDSFYGGGATHFNGEKCYALRCKLFHESTNDISGKTQINEFVLGFNDQRFFTGHLSGKDFHYEQYDPNTGRVPETNYLYVGVKEICTDILESAERFIAQNQDLDYPNLKMNYGGGKSPKELF